MQQRVGIRMAQQPVAVGDGDTAQDERPAGDELVNVPAFADAHVRQAHARSPRVCSSRSASAKSPGQVSLTFSNSPRPRLRRGPPPPAPPAPPPPPPPPP